MRHPFWKILLALALFGAAACGSSSSDDKDKDSDASGVKTSDLFPNPDSFNFD